MRLLLALLFCCTVCSAQSVDRLAHAISKAEGYGKAGTLPSRYRNPGDLKAVMGYVYPGQIKVGKGGHVVFRTSADGWAALRHQLDKIVAGESHYTVNMTLQEVGKRYAGNYRVWSKNVAHNLGVEPTTSLWEILGVPPVLDKQPTKEIEF